MNFEDEPYVRIYTRKTLTHKLLGWEGRVVMRLMIDEFDAAGIFEIRGDAAHCISAVTDLPIDIVRVGLARLLDTETWTVTARTVTWPTYEEAQNCSRSDRVRQRASRKARAARSVTDVTLPVTPEAPPVTSVTKCHSPSPPPSLPSTHPEDPDPERAREVPPAPEPERGGVARTISLPSQAPPKEYLDVALMGGVSLEQAKSTWKHYWGAGLPLGGVERLHDWLTLRAVERTQRLARASPKSEPRDSGGAELTTTSAATAFRSSIEHERFCAEKNLDLAHAVALYRQSPEHARVGCVESEKRFMARLKCWAATGTFHPDGPLPKPKKLPGQSAGGKEAA